MMVASDMKTTTAARQLDCLRLDIQTEGRLTDDNDMVSMMGAKGEDGDYWFESREVMHMRAIQRQIHFFERFSSLQYQRQAVTCTVESREV